MIEENIKTNKEALVCYLNQLIAEHKEIIDSLKCLKNAVNNENFAREIIMNLNHHNEETRNLSILIRNAIDIYW